MQLIVLTESISRIDNEKQTAHAHSMPDDSFHVDFKTMVDERIIEASENGLGTERLSSPDRGDHLFSRITPLSNVLEGKPDMD